MTLTLPPGVIVAFLLALVRASAWVTIAPPFSNKMIPAKVKVILAGALIFLVWNWSQPVLLAMALTYVGSGIAIRVGGIIRRRMRRAPRAPEHPEHQLG